MNLQFTSDIDKLMTILAKEWIEKSLPFPFNTILAYLINDVKEQKDAVSSLEFKVDQLIMNPFKEGLIYLNEANYSTKEADKTENIKEARKKFISTSEARLSSYPLLPIKSKFYVGVCYDLLLDNASANRWYGSAYNSILETIWSLPDNSIHRIGFAKDSLATNILNEMRNEKSRRLCVCALRGEYYFSVLDWIPRNNNEKCVVEIIKFGIELSEMYHQRFIPHYTRFGIPILLRQERLPEKLKVFKEDPLQQNPLLYWRGVKK